MARECTVVNRGLVSEVALASNCGDTITASMAFLSSDPFLAAADNLPVAVAKVVAATSDKMRHCVDSRIKAGTTGAGPMCWTHLTIQEMQRCFGQYYHPKSTIASDICPLAAHQYVVHNAEEDENKPSGLQALHGMHFWQSLMQLCRNLPGLSLCLNLPSPEGQRGLRCIQGIHITSRVRASKS
eukprot:5711839-Amphidinium_carterae.1